jgi:predicted AlkP superfamily phosphohydrolase/phosphomutase
MKVLVFGIDGGTLDLVGPWAQRGELPNLARLMGGGCSGVLRSTTHPLTPQAWTSFLTGVNPGKHGVFDFGCRRQGSYELRLTDARDRRAPALWDYLEPAGLTTGLCNVPLTYPVEPLHGFVVSGMHTPSLAAGVWPHELRREIEEVAPDYRIDVMSPSYTDLGLFLRDVWQMTEARGQAATHLYRTRRPDLFVLVMVAVDRVCHALYRQMSHPGAHGRDGRGDWRYSHAVLEAYRAIDRTLGGLLATIDEQTVVMVMSDHGFGTLERDVSLNQFFLEQGVMAFDPVKVRRRLPVQGVPFGAAGRSAAEALRDAIAEHVPPLRWLEERALRRGRFPVALRRWEYVDWTRTVAYSHGMFGNVYINLRGREPEGCVDPADYESVRSRVAELLATRLVDPADGGRVVDHIYRREELYSGPHLEEAPDLLVVMRGYAYMTRGAWELSATEIVAPPAINHTGNHRLDGMLILWGPGVRQGQLVGAHITDVAPTILRLLDLPVPQSMDGRVLSEALERPGDLRERALRLARSSAQPSPLTAEEEQLIRRRLKNLGYIE